MAKDKEKKKTEIPEPAYVHDTDTNIFFVENLASLQKESYNTLVKNAVAILCTRGSAYIRLNGMDLEIDANDILICQPHTLIEKYETSDDFDGYCSMMSKEYLYRVSMVSGGNWDMKVFIENNPILPLTDDEVETFSLYYNLLKKKLTDASGRHHREHMDALLGSFMIELHDILERFVVLNPPTFSSAENIFREFINLLSSSFPKKRDVTYYADALNVTPKYLSAICKNISGHTAFSLIGKYVVRDVEFMLKKQEMTIKEIANKLDFPNISFFGKYVKKHFGVPPRKYREELFKKTPGGIIGQENNARGCLPDDAG